MINSKLFDKINSKELKLNWIQESALSSHYAIDLWLWLTELWIYIPITTKHVTSKIFFPASHLAWHQHQVLKKLNRAQQIQQTSIPKDSITQNKQKLAPYRTNDRHFTPGVSAKFKVTWHKNWDKYKKSGLIEYRYCALVSVVSCHCKWQVRYLLKTVWFPTLKLVTLTSDRVILHTIVHHSSTSTYTPNFIEMEETFSGQTDVRTDVHLRPTLLPTLLGGLRRVDLINQCLFGLYNS